MFVFKKIMVNVDREVAHFAKTILFLTLTLTLTLNLNSNPKLNPKPNYNPNLNENGKGFPKVSRTFLHSRPI